MEKYTLCSTQFQASTSVTSTVFPAHTNPMLRSHSHCTVPANTVQQGLSWEANTGSPSSERNLSYGSRMFSAISTEFTVIKTGTTRLQEISRVL